MQLYILDTFTTNRFSGNPTPVCYTDKPLDTGAMLLVARELNMPVTAFVQPAGHARYHIRYFTPLTEIPTCGHATLAATAVLAETKEQNQVTFQTAHQVVLETRLEEGVVHMDYGRYCLHPWQPGKDLLRSIKVRSYKNSVYCPALQTGFIELESAAAVQQLQPDFKKLLSSQTDLKELVVTAASDTTNYDYILRAFCPWVGINEDPVTGSVHGALAPYWAELLGKRRLTAFQASGRGGAFMLRVRQQGVQISGRYVFVLKGNLCL